MTRVGGRHGPPWRRTARLAARALPVVAVSGGGLWVATHGVAGVAIGDVVAVLRGVSTRQLALLAVVWAGGLGIYATVLSAALPGLGVRRGLLLNLSGSAVANVVPFGGAVATAVNWRMVRGWGHATSSFATYCVLTNALDVATKLLLPVVAVVTAAAVSLHVPFALWVAAAVCAVVLLLGTGATVSLARSATSRAPVSPAPDHRAARGRRRRWALALRDTATRTSQKLAADWPRLLPASAAYVAAQVLLMGLSLHAVGLTVSPSVVLTAAAIERLGTVVALTPGGTGVAEIGTVAWLVATGADPALVVAGVLLYRLFLIGAEVPVGSLLLGLWACFARPLRTQVTP